MTGMLQSGLQDAVWLFDIYANKGDATACCRLAVKADTKENAYRIADVEAGKDKTLHPNHDIKFSGTIAETSNGDGRFDDGEIVKKIECQISHRTWTSKAELVQEINRKLSADKKIRFSVVSLEEIKNGVPNWAVVSIAISGKSGLIPAETEVLNNVCKNFANVNVIWS
jgi:hypothetical protein